MGWSARGEASHPAAEGRPSRPIERQKLAWPTQTGPLRPTSRWALLPTAAPVQVRRVSPRRVHRPWPHGRRVGLLVINGGRGFRSSKFEVPEFPCSRSDPSAHPLSETIDQGLVLARRQLRPLMLMTTGHAAVSAGTTQSGGQLHAGRRFYQQGSQ